MMEANKNIDLLDVAKLEWPRMAETAIDRLVMPLGTKELIKAIARTYTDQSQLFSADFIYGKGEGQIILLHGPPGTGKTLTAGAHSTPSTSKTDFVLTAVQNLSQSSPAGPF